MVVPCSLGNSKDHKSKLSILLRIRSYYSANIPNRAIVRSAPYLLRCMVNTESPMRRVRSTIFSYIHTTWSYEESMGALTHAMFSGISLVK